MRNAGAIFLLAGSSFLLFGCNRSTSATADSPTASSTASGSFDEGAARAKILGADSAYVRAMVSKNIDSLMVYYEPDAVSLGKTVVKGTADLRKTYLQAMKANTGAITFQSVGVNFSKDHSMAWDYGTFTQSSVGPNGKPVSVTGTFLNVWKNVGGNWRIAAEISAP